MDGNIVDAMSTLDEIAKIEHAGSFLLAENPCIWKRSGLGRRVMRFLLPKRHISRLCKQWLSKFSWLFGTGGELPVVCKALENDRALALLANDSKIIRYYINMGAPLSESSSLTDFLNCFSSIFRILERNSDFPRSLSKYFLPETLEFYPSTKNIEEPLLEERMPSISDLAAEPPVIRYSSLLLLTYVNDHPCGVFEKSLVLSEKTHTGQPIVAVGPYDLCLKLSEVEAFSNRDSAKALNILSEPPHQLMSYIVNRLLLIAKIGYWEKSSSHCISLKVGDRPEVRLEISLKTNISGDRHLLITGKS